ncbi:unnamed protein product [Rhizophagus irregularis]|nr:unnamed protein product [Rhizophagus irregularis]
METVLDEDSATTVTTQTSRSSRTSRSKGPSKSTILRNKQKEKEELDNQILLQEVKDRYETLASESTYEIIRRISEKMKSIDLAKLSFNNPQYENVQNWKGFTTEFIKWIDSLLNGQEPQTLERQQEECEYIKIMYQSLKEVWDRGRYQNKLKDDCSILEDTHIHEIMHNILYNTIKVSNGKIAIDWTRKTSEEGNEKVDLDYDIWLSQMKATERKMQQTTFQSRNIPDWMAQYCIGDFLYEFLYGEAASPPYQSTTVRTEGNRRKLIRFMSRSVRRAKEKLVSQFSNIADGDLMDDV